MSMTLAFWFLFLAGVAAFAAQVARRVQLIAAAPDTFSLDNLGVRTSRFVVDVLLQWRTIKERPFTGLMHAFVFWGFVAFGGYTLTEFLYGLGLIDLTHAGWFHAYRLALTPFATANHLASWAGMCPGNNESAGKRRSGRMR